MKYEVEEKRRKAAADKETRFVSICKTYSDSNNWGEFMLKTTLDGNILSKREKFTFWTYYLGGNYGRGLVGAAIPISVFAASFLLMLLACAGGTYDLLMSVMLAIFAAPIPTLAITSSVNNGWSRIRRAEYDYKQSKDMAEAAEKLKATASVPISSIAANAFPLNGSAYYVPAYKWCTTTSPEYIDDHATLASGSNSLSA